MLESIGCVKKKTQKNRAEFLSWLSGLQIRLGTMRLQVQSPALLSGLRIWCCRELWCRLQMQLDLDPVLLWLWRRPVATGPIQALAWEPPYAAGAAQRNSKKTKNK